MTDYQPLIARAVDGLAKNTGDARRALYERARAALVTQLRAVEPALSESDITKERLALEESIRKVESDAARKALMDPRLESRAAASSARPLGGESRGLLSIDSGETPRRERSAALLSELPLEPKTEAQRAEPATPIKLVSEAEAEVAAPAAKVTARNRILQARTSSLSQDGIKGFRNVVHDADGLGAASARAAQRARDTRDSYGPASYQQFPEADLPPPPSRREQFEPHFEDHELLPEEEYPLALHGLEPPYDIEDDQHAAAPRPARPQLAHADEVDEEYAEPRPPRSYRGWATLAVLLIILGAAAAGAWQYRPFLVGWYHTLLPSKPQTASQTTQAPAPASKFAGRVPQEPVPGQAPAAGAKSSTQSPPEVAQPAVLYEADPNDPQGKRFAGSVVWRTETVSPGPGLAPELVVRADISIPERHMTVTWSLRRNTDKALPASHTIEIMFNLPPDFPGGGISNVPGILMKDSEAVRGMPLAGLAVKVTNGFFLIGLNAAEEDMQRNMELLKQRSWFDILIVYNNGSRAILTIQKGPPGDRAFAEAFSAWGE